ncbi:MULTISPECIES: MarR family transcriptional regulator [unclassified Afipia]|uniref:MarR family transcriptional regulator n=1 Tax=unclassified Afipia TaxID=2642050 RepID=UPI00042834D0|nr:MULTISPECIES: MarR family transcriptional regulator [unclassified Afipia]
MNASLNSDLDEQERALLAMDVAWVQWRSEFRQKLVANGVLGRPVRSIFEADMIFAIIAHHALKGRPVTLKEVATYFGSIATDATVSRHIDDMVQNGLVERRVDGGDRRRMFLIPTRRLEGIGHEFEQARLRIMRENGFVWNGGNNAG